MKSGATQQNCARGYAAECKTMIFKKLRARKYDFLGLLLLLGVDWTDAGVIVKVFSMIFLY
jgi:hypothetical protein